MLDINVTIFEQNPYAENTYYSRKIYVGGKETKHRRRQQIQNWQAKHGFASLKSEYQSYRMRFRTYKVT